MGNVVLVTGGAGFIGSHICKALAIAGLKPVAYDNLSTGHADSVLWGPLVEDDLADTRRFQRTLERCRPLAVIHCAANAYVGESVIEPAKYYRNNVVSGIALLEACHQVGIHRLVFSSSCATYGIPQRLPIVETSPQVPINPYGRTKLIFEMALDDYAAAYGLRHVTLRYFNAAGADPDGELHERHEPETHLIPRALLAAAGRLPRLEIFGNDYPTMDGTCIRDYVHVADLADAHVAAVRHLLVGGESLHVNLGSGAGTSVNEVLTAIKRVTGRSVPVAYQPRRAGDPPALVTDTAKAARGLGFLPHRSDIDTIIRTAAPSFGLAVLT